MLSKVIVNEKLNFIISQCQRQFLWTQRMFERTNEMLLTVSGSRLVQHSDTMLPAALNAVLVSCNGTAECCDVFKFGWVILDST
jgi:hypothetical protein